MPSKRKAKSPSSSSAAEKLDSSSSKKLKSQVDEEAVVLSSPKVDPPSRKPKPKIESNEEMEPRFVGSHVPEEEAKERWPHRYLGKKKHVAAAKDSIKDAFGDLIQARYHYLQTQVDGEILYNLYDDAHVKAGEGEEDYICRIVEMFESVDKKLYFTAQWYYRAKDTVIKDHANLIDCKRVFFSEIRDDNPLDCLVKKLHIARLPLNVDSDKKKQSLLTNDFYCDMQYLIPYSSFVKLLEGPTDNVINGNETSSTISSDVDTNGTAEVNSERGSTHEVQEHNKPEVTLLDLYSGCGAMSTGLCLGAQLSGLNLVTRWAVDLNEHACDSLKLNHPETNVRNEATEDFLTLLKEWKNLCIYFSLIKSNEIDKKYVDLFSAEGEEEEDIGSDEEEERGDPEVFEVDKLLEICYGDRKENGKSGLYFKVRWKGYGAEADSWEPIEGLSHCKERIKEFISNGYKSKILPLQGDVNVICGGPPCQGISGFNRFRNKENPLKDEKNKQLIVFMDLVDYLKPKYVLMENVVDLVKFAHGFLGRYALGRLIAMNYQVRMGMLAAGAFGLPQFRMRVFMWGAWPAEKLPQYPLPTHDVLVRGIIPVEFEMNAVAYDEGQNPKLESRLQLEDAISDLPSVGNDEHRDEMPYGNPPRTEFQRFIRSKKEEASCMLDVLYDHRPLELNADDHQRACRIPKLKGANFRNLPGVRVRPDNKVEWDPQVERVYLDSGKPLVPDYAMSFVNGSSSKPFARLWWDETVPTVVTRAEPHNQAILHPDQDRVLTIRENARLQGFPDYYKLLGPVKERYIQVGNAVAVPVARALGYGLGLACQGLAKEEALFRLPHKFPNAPEANSPASSQEEDA